MNNTHFELIKLLSAGNLVSDEQLASRLNISKIELSEAIEFIKMHYHSHIHSIPNKGYFLSGGLSILDKSKIVSDITPLIILTNVKSTNDYLLNLVRDSNEKFMAVLAEQQTEGRGRRGKSWVSPFGENIYCSVLYRFNPPPFQLDGFSLLVALSVLNALVEYGLPKEKLKCKWPNDIYYDGKKLSGILIDLVSESNSVSAVVIGVGINTSTPKHIQDSISISQTAIGIDDILNALTDRNKLASILIKHLYSFLLEWKEDAFRESLTTWNEFDYCLNKKVFVFQSNRVIEGISRGVSVKGELQVEIDGRIQLFLSGEVSLRAASVTSQKIDLLAETQ